MVKLFPATWGVGLAFEHGSVAPELDSSGGFPQGTSLRDRHVSHWVLNLLRYALRIDQMQYLQPGHISVYPFEPAANWNVRPL